MSTGTEPPPAFRIAAACHLFHPDLADETRAALANIPGSIDVFVSTDTEEKCKAIRAAFDGWDKGRLEYRLVPNRGRDIGPKLTAFTDVHHGYDLVLHLHGKRSSHLGDGAEWRQYLLHNLAGSPAIAGSVLDAFRRDPGLGIIASQHWDLMRPWVDWSKDFQCARELARRMGVFLTPAHAIDFPTGSMFWARPAALRPLTRIGLQADDFPPESGQIDGTLAHAIERLFFFSCEAAGLRWAKVSDPAFGSNPLPVFPIDTPADLDVFRRKHGFRLTALASP